MSSPESLTHWLNQPNDAFSNWLDIQKYKDSSKVVYRAMWGKFVKWIDEKGFSLEQCTDQHIAGFLDDSELNKGIRQRYVRLIERVYIHLDGLGLRISNPGKEAAYGYVGAGKNDPMRCLDHQERDQVFQGIRQVWAKWEEEAQREKNWAEIRDAAMIGVITGSGAKVAELVQLTVNCTDGGERITLGAGTKREHFGLLLPIGKEALAVWENVRLHVPQHSRLLFPADMSRRQKGVQKVSAVLDPTTVYRRLNRMLVSFGIDGARTSAQTLRNTYAAMLIEAGYDDGVLGSAMGFTEQISAPRLRHAHEQWALTQK